MNMYITVNIDFEFQQMLIQKIQQYNSQTKMSSQEQTTQIVQQQPDAVALSDSQQDAHDQYYEEAQSDQTLVFYHQYKIVDLPEIPLVTLEQNQQRLEEIKVKLYRWKQSQWKQRGVGFIRFLKHKTTGVIRAVMKEDKTFFIRANFVVEKIGPFCQLKKSPYNEFSYIWRANDFSSNPNGQNEIFSIKLRNQEDANKFQTIFESSCEQNKNKGNNQMEQHDNLFD